MLSGDYIMVHTRSHDMSADIYAIGFTDGALFNRLRFLIGVYTPADKAQCSFNPIPLGADKLPATDDSGYSKWDCNTQYGIIMSGKSHEMEQKKPVKLKPPKGKGKPKARPPPASRYVASGLRSCFVGDLHGCDTSWFARVDYGADHYQRSNADDRCPL